LSYLLDVNLLIALAWPSHVHHVLAQNWFANNCRAGWSTCPITQTGFVRISSNPKFIDGAVTPREAITLLSTVTASEDHTFWSDDLNVADTQLLPVSHLLGHQQVTDAYLLSLAIKHNGKLTTLDQGVSALIPDIKRRRKHLVVVLD
jgi:toxin-antitoxin system PIN domain toxin